MLNDYIYLMTELELNVTWSALLNRTSVGFMLLLFFGVLLFFESHTPRERISSSQLKQSYKTNLGLFLLNNVVLSILSITSLFVLARHYSDQGLLAHLSDPLLKATLSLLGLDLVLYIWHRLCHTFDYLWIFHKVHHSDPYLNVTTAFRLHILDVLFTNLFKAIFIMLLGIDEIMVFISEAISTACIMFHHTNTRFKGEKWLGYVFVVPYLHRAHHSILRKQHDTNYGAILSLWDTLLGTRTEVNPITLGTIDYLPNDIMSLTKAGFTQSTLATPSVVIQPDVLEHMIAEAAYYKAEKRGFNPGHEIHDWLEAKREIIAAYCDSKWDNQQVGQY